MVAALHPTPEAARGRPLDRAHPVYVYAWPVRLWHWISAIGVVTLAITGFLIARPIPSPPGEAIDHFVMGYTRGIHLSAAWLVTVGFALRLYVAVLGKTGSREIFVAPVWRGEAPRPMRGGYAPPAGGGGRTESPPPPPPPAPHVSDSAAP